MDLLHARNSDASLEDTKGLLSPDHSMIPSYGSKDTTLPVSNKPASRRNLLDANSHRAQRKLQVACLFSILFMLAEIVGGFLAGSLAIMTDAAHLLSDVAGFCISLFAIYVSTLPASAKLSFGFLRAEVIGAITSVLVIWVLTGVLVYAAVERFLECLHPDPKEHVNGKLMFIVACIGLIVNLILMRILGHGHGHSHSHGGHGHSHGGHTHNHHNHKQRERIDEQNIIKSERIVKLENINIEAAYIHALGDFIQSIGVCIAGGLIWYNPSWQIADPIATFIFSLVVLGTTFGIVTSSLHVLMEGTPEGIDHKEIEIGLRACASVYGLHDLHIWSLSAGLPSLSVHLISDDPDAALHEAQNFLLSKGITHTTIQVEKASRQYPRDCASDLKCGQDSPHHL